MNKIYQKLSWRHIILSGGSSVFWTGLWNRRFSVQAPVLMKHGRCSVCQKHCQGTREQGAEPTDARIGPCNELVLMQGWICIRPLYTLPVTPKGITQLRIQGMQFCWVNPSQWALLKQFSLECVFYYVHHYLGTIKGYKLSNSFSK